MLPRFRPLGFLAAFAGLLAVSVAPQSVHAQGTGDVYTVRDVKVDETAASAADARTKAVEQGQRTAFQTLYNRLAITGSAPVTVPDDETLAELVKGFEVQDERASGVRYVATLSYEFDPTGMRNVFSLRNARFTDVQSKPVLVLPVTRSNDQVDLWQEGSLWRAAWESRTTTNALVPVLVPLGDLNDVSDISAEQAMSGDQVALQAIAQRYGAGSIMVAIYDETTPDTMTAIRYPLTGPVQTTKISAPPEGTEDILGSFAQTSIGALQEEWKQANAIAAGTESQITVSIPVESAEALADIQRRLNEVPLIKRRQLIALAPGAAEMRLNFQGDAEHLSTALAQKELSLEQIMPATGAGAGSLAAPLDPLTGQPISNMTTGAGWELRRSGTALQPGAAAP